MPNFDINISLPIASNSIAEVSKAIAPFAAELEALKQKLPETAIYKDSITGQRTGSPGQRKTMADRIAEGVAEELAKRTPEPPTETAAPRVPRGVHAAQ